MTTGSAPTTGLEQPSKDALVVRSNVPIETDYLKYRPYLRKDFFYSCGYCTLTEAEALGIRFTIDHYEPQSFRPDLVAKYENLMYSCGECNLRKGDISPPPEARAKGIRFFRPDQDSLYEHFELKYLDDGWYLNGLTPIGTFSVDYLDLNRQWLKRLRGLRQELSETVRFTAFGIAALRGVPLDQLPTSIRGKAASAIQRKVAVLDFIEDELDDLLRSIAKSDLLDEDPENERRAQERAAKMLGHKALFPGTWRAPRGIKRKRSR